MIRGGLVQRNQGFGVYESSHDMQNRHGPGAPNHEERPYVFTAGPNVDKIDYVDPLKPENITRSDRAINYDDIFQKRPTDLMKQLADILARTVGKPNPPGGPGGSGGAGGPGGTGGPGGGPSIAIPPTGTPTTSSAPSTTGSFPGVEPVTGTPTTSSASSTTGSFPGVEPDGIGFLYSPSSSTRNWADRLRHQIETINSNMTEANDIATSSNIDPFVQQTALSARAREIAQAVAQLDRELEHPPTGETPENVNAIHQTMRDTRIVNQDLVALRQRRNQPGLFVNTERRLFRIARSTPGSTPVSGSRSATTPAATTPSATTPSDTFSDRLYPSLTPTSSRSGGMYPSVSPTNRGFGYPLVSPTTAATSPGIIPATRMYGSPEIIDPMRAIRRTYRALGIFEEPNTPGSTLPSYSPQPPSYSPAPRYRYPSIASSVASSGPQYSIESSGSSSSSNRSNRRSGGYTSGIPLVRATSSDLARMNVDGSIYSPNQMDVDSSSSNRMDVDSQAGLTPSPVDDLNADPTYSPSPRRRRR